MTECRTKLSQIANYSIPETFESVFGIHAMHFYSVYADNKAIVFKLQMSFIS